ncbi:hypothetical protein V6N11_047868 [Hibiscus sabdariffa]|uniref:Uncharacterized protein n=1 Tax=Hibiscus sabdariffa TaxID=183260 RepID=A0ABR2N8U4_9ROSI
MGNNISRARRKANPKAARMGVQQATGRGKKTIQERDIRRREHKLVDRGRSVRLQNNQIPIMGQANARPAQRAEASTIEADPETASERAKPPRTVS